MQFYINHKIVQTNIKMLIEKDKNLFMINNKF